MSGAKWLGYNFKPAVTGDTECSESEGAGAEGSGWIGRWCWASRPTGTTPPSSYLTTQAIDASAVPPWGSRRSVSRAAWTVGKGAACEPSGTPAATPPTATCSSRAVAAVTAAAASKQPKESTIILNF